MGGVTHLLLLLWVGVTVSTAVDLQKRVVRGARCRNTERHYHVKLVDNNNNFVCGGSVIAKQWILTSAHCLPNATRVILGVHPGPEEPAQTPIQTEIYHDSNGRQHDIMLWKLQNPTDIQPVAKPDCSNLPRVNIDQVQIAGHGSSVPCRRCNFHEPRSPDLQCANITVVDCLWITSHPAYLRPQDRVFCGDSTHADACKGDCGGAVLHNNRIYGIIQGGHGTPPCTDPVKFMDICAYMYWINKKTKKPFLEKVKGCIGCG